MPNWAYNRLTITSTKKRLIEIREAVKGDQRILDGEVEPFDFYTLKEDGDFGVKWNACEVEYYDASLDNATSDDDECELEYNFNTAWNWPEPVLKAFCEKYPDIKIDYTCTEESYTFAVHGWNDHGEFIYNEIDSNDMFYSDNYLDYIDRYFDEHTELNKDDYNLDDFFDAVTENISWEVEDYDFDYTEKTDDDGNRVVNDFENLIIRPYDDEEFESLLDDFKN